MGDFLDEMLTMMSQTKSNVSHLVSGMFGDKAMQLQCCFMYFFSLADKARHNIVSAFVKYYVSV